MVTAGAACYAPFPPASVPCDPEDPRCPSGQACVAGAGGFVCSAGPGLSPDAPDAPGDTGPDLCFGTGLVRDLCFDELPSGTLSISGAATLDTATVGGVHCTAIAPQPGGPSLCVVARATIRVEPAATLRVTGPNPLVLVAAETIEVAGVIDASGHSDGVAGPGARTIACQGQTPGQNAQGEDGGGGGAGGSFGGAGGNGGNGVGGPGGGVAGPVSAAALVIGGCPGSRGGNGGGGGGGSPGGPGGGAIYAIARGSISITGTIAASGGGGRGGTGGANSGGGGGGGGSGGLIALDAPAAAVTGRLHANGGGGGGGNGDAPTARGDDGSDPVMPATAAPGGGGGNGGGGNGGAGFAQGSPARPGNGTNSTYCGGGGGGGGAGVIRVFQAPGTLGGSVSPAPTP
jgi:hypothetical protein